MTDTTPSKSTLREDLSTMPENHLDVVVAPGSIDENRAASLRTRITAIVSMPLFFLLAFTICYVSAAHAPVPHDLALTLAGPRAVTSELADAINDKAPGAFDITQTTNSATAQDAVTQRDAVGALLIDGTDVTTIVASGGGALAVQTVTTAGQQVAAELGGNATVENVAPLPSDDPGGSILFLFLVICTVGAFLAVTGITQAFPKARARAMVLTAAGAAAIVPVIGFSLISVYVDYEVSFGTVAALLGIGMLYTFTIGLIATVLTLLLGQAAILGEILVLVALNFPSAGGSVPASMLPPFWQVIHNIWVGSAGFEAMRSVMFFDGNQVAPWLLQLVIWTVAAFVLTLFIAFSRRKRARSTTPDTVLELSASPSAL